MVRPNWSTVYFDKMLLRQRHINSSIYCLWPLSHCNSRAEWSAQSLNIYYLAHDGKSWQTLPKFQGGLLATCTCKWFICTPQIFFGHHLGLF